MGFELITFDPVKFVLLLLSLCLSFLLSGMEAGVFALNRLRIRHLARTGHASAKLLQGYLENPENFLWTIVVGNTVANFAILGLLMAALNMAFGHNRALFVAAFIVAVFLFYTFCDLLPKMLFRLYPNRLCLAMARPFRFVHIGLRPLVRFVEWCSRLSLRWSGSKTFTGRLFGNREELRLLMRESARSFSSEERAMINRVLDLQTLTVKHITTPIARTVCVEAHQPVSDVFKLCREHNVTRLPVWDTRDGQRRIVGLADLDALLFEAELDQTKPIGEFIKPAAYIDHDTSLESALGQLQRSGQRMAVVLGPDAREIGIVTLADIFKAIFGEITL
ncbi:MAG: CNNM domain-containing protein [Verrucomicrobiae bacterium]|nr:CNNM domain-containing protein [Verrucomicrobiae bacterium]